MLYVGLDIHIKNIFICILNDNGKIERQLKVRQVDQMMDVLNKLPCCASEHSGVFARELATFPVRESEIRRVSVRVSAGKL